MVGGWTRSSSGVLSGYLDTDGCVQKHYLKWYSVNRPLLEDCQVLLESLGDQVYGTDLQGETVLALVRGVAFDQEEFFCRLQSPDNQSPDRPPTVSAATDPRIPRKN